MTQITVEALTMAQGQDPLGRPIVVRYDSAMRYRDHHEASHTLLPSDCLAARLTYLTPPPEHSRDSSDRKIGWLGVNLFISCISLCYSTLSWRWFCLQFLTIACGCTRQLKIQSYLLVRNFAISRTFSPAGSTRQSQHSTLTRAIVTRRLYPILPTLYCACPSQTVAEQRPRSSSHTP